MMMMMIIIKIIIGGHHRLIFMHLLKVYARSKTTGIDRFARYSLLEKREVHNLKCSRERVTRKLRTKCLFKSNKRSLNETLFQCDFQ